MAVPVCLDLCELFLSCLHDQLDDGLTVTQLHGGRRHHVIELVKVLLITPAMVQCVTEHIVWHA